jgi:hypothetical protein
VFPPVVVPVVVDVAVEAEFVSTSVHMVVLLRFEAPELKSSVAVVISSGLLTFLIFSL